MRQIWWLPLPILALLLFCALYEGPRIEAHLQSAAQASLSAAGLTAANATFDGRDALLTGSVASGELKSEAARLVADVRGVRRVVNALEASDPLATSTESAFPKLQMSFGADGLELSGVVNSETEAALLEASRALYPEGQIVNRLERDDSLTDIDGLPGLLERLPELQAQLPAGRVDISPETLTLEGEVLGETARASLQQVFEPLAGERNLINNLTAEGVDVSAEASAEVSPATDVPVPDAEVSVDETGAAAAETPVATAEETESDDTTATQDTSQANASASSTAPATNDADVTATEAVTETPATPSGVAEPQTTDPASEASTAVDASSGASAETTSASETASTDEVGASQEASVETAEVTPTEGSSDAQTAQVEASTEPGESTPGRNPSYRLDISGANVRLSGELPNQDSVARAEAAFSAGRSVLVTNALEATDEVSTPDWLPELFALGPRLTSLLDNATLELDGDTLSLTGNAPSADARQAVITDISRSLPGLRVVNDLGIAAPGTIPFSEEGK